MKIANVHELKLKQLESGEKVQVLLGRHKQHHATNHQTIAVVELAPGLSSDPRYQFLRIVTHNPGRFIRMSCGYFF